MVLRSLAPVEECESENQMLSLRYGLASGVQCHFSSRRRCHKTAEAQEL